MPAQESSRYKQNLLNQMSSIHSRIRSGEYTGPTTGLGPGFVQGNVVILPVEWADEFLLYCQKNPIACPLIGVSQPGEPMMSELGRDIDIRHDVPEYQVFRNGERAETVTDISSLWQSDMVAFVLGCSYSFEDAMQMAGLSIRNVEASSTVSVYRTKLATVPAGRFHGDMVVSMRPFNGPDAIRAIQITSRFPKAHGAPVHIGDPSSIGISDLNKPDFGEPVSVNDDELPLFWGCGVTPQVALENARPPIAITHVPGKMLITELLNEELAAL